VEQPVKGSALLVVFASGCMSLIISRTTQDYFNFGTQYWQTATRSLDKQKIWPHLSDKIFILQMLEFHLYTSMIAISKLAAVAEILDRMLGSFGGLYPSIR